MARKSVTTKDIPKSLELPVKKALSWLNSKQKTNYKVTGLAQPLPARDKINNSAFILHLVLCENDICTLQSIQISRSGLNWFFKIIECKDEEIPSLLDPPKGDRIGWIEKNLIKYEFILLLFYRGLW